MISFSSQRILMMMLLALVSGCASWVTPRVSLVSVNSEYLLLAAQQQWQVHHEESDYRLQAVVQIEDARWTLVFMDSLGQRLATLVQDQEGLDIQSHKSHPLDKDSGELAQSLQFIYWPLADLQQQPVEGWSFNPVESGRQVFFSGILAAQIDYLDANPWQGSARYANNKSEFRLVIESRQLHAQKR